MDVERQFVVAIRSVSASVSAFAMMAVCRIVPSRWVLRLVDGHLLEHGVEEDSVARVLLPELVDEQRVVEPRVNCGAIPYALSKQEYRV